ncbi:hypothetical protein LO762_18325 [Actinocorallia sp. API 0066]|uniref:hypothetical protein n=1 Tax=Actinocorallia sp. API 0066 TaxID=2896846 RepID=UPI001E306B3C|nr:hypothetical protein [Actinocorallia sp. API 0066]MCD0451140.1 hypothetical protein [Actinocorallia sp. API 0066]
MFAKRFVTGFLLTVGAFAIGMGSAYAASEDERGKGGTLKHATTGADFKGSWKWDDKIKVKLAGGTKTYRGVRYWGTLTDTNKGDKHNVYTEANGTSRPRVYGKRNGSKWVSTYETSRNGKTVSFKVCRDRGTLRPDNCSKQQVLRR